ncbi:MAG: DASS family sodium-coupled anion symporter [Deltaproteobacteria bacterium]|nr:DASS family sodium-coupled anion symporter [Deltaproteobacteria bacterium]MBW2064816.1 DASS family sodium-coupled anion symporter [Deltaproteobacteria bacterium]
MKREGEKRATGYDKYVNWRLFVIPLGALIILLMIPTPKSMIDVGVEYSMGPKYVQRFFAERLFGKRTEELSQWQVQMVQMMEKSIESSSFKQTSFLKRGQKWCSQNGIPSSEERLKQIRVFTRDIPAGEFQRIMYEGYQLRSQGLSLEGLEENDKAQALKAAQHVKVAVGIVLFVVLCFVTEAIPLPMVAFCIGIIAIMSGIVTRENIASLYWSDATWFIMGSLMFATAFVKTGVDKRIVMMMFGKLKNPDIKWVTLIIILVISPLTMFMSDHALAAMFLPIGILLYSMSAMGDGTEDPELAKMLMITIAMACNLGGSLAPSGAARNIIMMGYAEDMFGISMGFGEWLLYCVPFLFFLVPVTWIVINLRFRPRIRNLGNAMDTVKGEVEKLGKAWTRKQKIAVIIFGIMLFCWITEKNLILKLTGIRFGIGVIAVMGAIAYIFAGIVNWRDYQTKVDWGVVWLYAGAIIFGRVLVETGGAYWIARSIVQLTEPLGLAKGIGLLISGNAITAMLTQVMADGPTCAAVGPVTLSMAGIVHPGTSMIPFMSMSTAIASSFAYCLVIGTPPNAIVYASGYLESKDYLRVGVILWFTNMAGLILLTSMYWRLLGWSGLPSY